MYKSGVIEYKHDDYECEGFAVWDDAGAKRPGILVFPEWVGSVNTPINAPKCLATLASTPSWSTSMARVSARTLQKPAKPR